ncbi:MAG: aspartate kinase [Thiobacillus sp.]|uniref:aspartate kinase n=1 Tax=unclassified Thiobacillus TaxID=2646513 RepID=UPI000869D5E6|nr:MULTISPECIES: aspartate kinase [unclassified Thiobacillus]MBS0310402.1 aspartate kinase [Pseudomonadota bacterium]MBN8771256.1 aspartate kinase [Thiobacillus sp.]MBN8779689.1 aspartate kinase [Thiobacillus sp.]ODU99990.1 MAG: aspartate kinase [Thiobacillus sp. SCN 63-57]OJY54952.1 MAG: aspartate kinase [Thiobacillus sp. 0-1251]
MALIVQKYGGTSVANVERIRAVAERVAKFKMLGHQVVVVLSAMSGETNRLIALAKGIQAQPDPRELDMLVSTGEQVTIALLAMALKDLGLKAKSYTGAQVRILTDNAFTKARILSIDEANMRRDLDSGHVVVVAGFQGVDADGNITTLGRGGSDTTGVALAAALKADECQIYTDVDGVYTTDPRIVPEARRLKTVTFEEMLEMASLGSKVLQIRSVEFAGKYKVKLRVLSSFQDEGDGTLITFEESDNMEQAIISGIAFNRDEAKITVVGVPDQPGIAYQILGPVADANIDVDMIVQNVGHANTTDFTFTVHRNDFAKAMDIVKANAATTGAREVTGDDKIAKVSIVGVGMRSHVGIARKMFETLSKENINLQMISTSEIKISVVVEDKYMELAVRALHQAFELDKAPA